MTVRPAAIRGPSDQLETKPVEAAIPLGVFVGITIRELLLDFITEGITPGLTLDQFLAATERAYARAVFGHVTTIQGGAAYAGVGRKCWREVLERAGVRAVARRVKATEGEAFGGPLLEGEVSDD